MRFGLRKGRQRGQLCSQFASAPSPDRHGTGQVGGGLDEGGRNTRDEKPLRRQATPDAVLSTAYRAGDIHVLLA